MSDLFAARTQTAISPVWEANHVWIILAVVILFNGFPKAFSEISILFHLPLLTMLVGIVLRGCAFTFRHYDAAKASSQKYYAAIFMFSSFLTPLVLGMIAGGLMLGRAAPFTAPFDGSFYGTFVAPWLNPFCFSLGVFTCCLFSFLAAVYLVGKTSKPALKVKFSKKARIANVLAVLSGVAVFVSAEMTDLHFGRLFFSNRFTLLCLVLATVILGPLWISLSHKRVWWPRLWASLQVLLILGGWFALQFPALLVSVPSSLTIYNTAAPEATLRYLMIALVAGLCFILPALTYLFKIFKLPQRNGIENSNNV